MDLILVLGFGCGRGLSGLQLGMVDLSGIKFVASVGLRAMGQG